jgi:cytoskeletal protein CcmA (bactofilin family)
MRSVSAARAKHWDLEYPYPNAHCAGSRHKKNGREFACVLENDSMLKKTDSSESGLSSIPSKTENNPAFVISNSGDSEKSSATITVENTDVSRVRSKNVSEFGSTLVFKGELSADEEILIQGTIEGTIVHHEKTLIVGKQGRVKGLIHAHSVTIEGQVEGDIHGEVMVRLTGSADVSGDIFCARISMDDGARFNGTMYMR